MIKYSFIIPVKEINNYIRETIPKILEIRRDDFEIIIYPDFANEEKWAKTRQLPTGKMGPANKRTLAIRDALGEILIFIDDDAYPENNFLDISEGDFANKQICAVGGPAITPRYDSFWQKVSGAVFLSSLSHSHPERYAPMGKKRFVDDWPSVNLSVRKKDFIAVGGFDTAHWPGEDTKLCLDLIKNGKQILYDPLLIAYHHRREGLLRHLKQLGGYGLHRGYFAKKYPSTSLKFKYFIPSFFFLFVAATPLLLLSSLRPNMFSFVSFISPEIISRFAIFILTIGWFVYILALVKAFYDIKKYEKVSVALHALYYIFLTHLWYGARFIQGFVFTKQLKSKLR